MKKELPIIKYQISIVVLCVLMFTSCIEPPKYSDIPEVTAVEFNKTGISSGTEKFELRIYFQDGNGDFDGGANNLFITESRTCFTDVYTIPAIERNGNTDDISGIIAIPDLTELCVLEWKNPTETDCLAFEKVNTITDTVQYDIQIQDNAGNESNVLTSPELYIICN